MTPSTDNLPLTTNVTPSDQAALVATIREAVASGTPLYPLGGTTQLDYGAWPTRPGIGLSLERLDRVVDHAADDMTITVEAGMTLAALAKHLATKNQRLPLDVRLPERATIGGLIATNRSGPRRYALGTIRDYAIGITAVDGRGKVISGGGRVVKNVAGYDLCRLMVGSLGTLGVITQVTLMVRPIPEAQAVLACDLCRLDQAETLLAALTKTKTLPIAIELLTRPTADAPSHGMGHHAAPPFGPIVSPHIARLLVGFEGSGDDVGWMVEQLLREWRALGVADVMSVFDKEVDSVWSELAAFDSNVQINVLPGVTIEAIERLRDIDPACAIQAHAGNGVLHICLSRRMNESLSTRLQEELRPAIAELSASHSHNGRLVVTSSSADAGLSPADIWGPPHAGAAIFRAIHDRFDPDGLLNPGRFVYEI